MMLFGTRFRTGLASGGNASKRLACLVVGAALPASLAAQVPPALLDADVAQQVQRLMAEHGIPGVSVAVVRNYQLAQVQTFGVADNDTRQPVTDSTLFQVASMSKPVTSVGLMRLVQAGRLELDAPVNDALKTWHIPENRHNRGRAITLRQLLSHTAGINGGGIMGLWGGSAGYYPTRYLPTELDILTKGRGRFWYPKVGSVRPPGADWRYSGAGYVVAQLLLAETVRRPFAWAMDSLVFRPLGMQRSTFEQQLTARQQQLAATGHRAGGGTVRGKRKLYPDMAAAGLFTTPTDLARLLIELQLAYLGRSERLLTQQTARTMFSKVRTPTGKQWALGWNFYDGPDGQPNAWFHNGSVRGMRSYMLLYPDKGFALVIVTNSNKGKELINPVRQQLMKRYM